MARTIGLLGGTFNPVHEGHLSIAREALRLFSLDAVWFIPCAVPAHKPTNNLAPNEDRLAMLCLAIADDPRFFALTIELDRPGTSYTLDTVRELRAQHPADTFVFIIGADTLGTSHLAQAARDCWSWCASCQLARPGTTPTPPPSICRPLAKTAGRPAQRRPLGFLPRHSLKNRRRRTRQACRARPALHSGAQPIPMNTKKSPQKESRPAQARNPQSCRVKTATPKSAPKKVAPKRLHLKAAPKNARRLPLPPPSARASPKSAPFWTPRKAKTLSPSMSPSYPA